MSNMDDSTKPLGFGCGAIVWLICITLAGTGLGWAIAVCFMGHDPAGGVRIVVVGRHSGLITLFMFLLPWACLVICPSLMLLAIVAAYAGQKSKLVGCLLVTCGLLLSAFWTYVSARTGDGELGIGAVGALVGAGIVAGLMRAVLEKMGLRKRRAEAVGALLALAALIGLGFYAAPHVNWDVVQRDLGFYNQESK